MSIMTLLYGVSLSVLFKLLENVSLKLKVQIASIDLNHNFIVLIYILLLTVYWIFGLSCVIQ